MGWAGRLFEAGRSFTFSAFRMGAYWRWALIRGWAIIPINTANEWINLLIEHIISIREILFRVVRNSPSYRLHC